MSGLFVLLVLIGIVGFIAKCLGGGQPSKRKPTLTPAWHPPAADPLPYAAKRYIFSAAERSFYEVVKRLVPSHTIFAKVRVADLLSVKAGSASWQGNFNKISCKHVDFVICDSNLAPVLIIELDDSSHDREDRKDRDAFVDRAFEAAKMPVVHVRAKAAYQIAELQAVLQPHIRTSAQAPTLPDDARYMPPLQRSQK